MTERPWLEHYDPGVPATIQYPSLTIQDLLDNAAQLYPERACTLFGDSALTYADMKLITDRVARGILELGVAPGDRVGLLLGNTPQFVMAFYGVLKAGGVVVATNPFYTGEELASQVRDSSIKVMFIEEGLSWQRHVALEGAGVRSFVLCGLSGGAASLGERPGRPRQDASRSTQGDVSLDEVIGLGESREGHLPSVPPRSTALFQYSGGTTGVSKAAEATHRGVVANTLQFRHWLVTLEDAKEVVLLAIPLYHAYGMIAGMSLGVSIGASLALVPSARDLPALLQAINQHRPTVFPGVPALYNAINGHPDVQEGQVGLGSIRVCISGSTALMPETKRRFEELSGGRICEGYGLSEAPVVTHCNPLLGINKAGSIGMPMPDVDCRLVDPDDGEQDVPPGTSGELILRGPQLMRAYHGLPVETAEALRTLRDGYTWLFTGDIVRMDEDGYFYIVDRKKELIKPGGFQVWPREVEEAIAAHPAVQEAAVAGVPDLDRGEAVKAWIVLRMGQRASAGEILAWCRERLAPYKVPTMIVFREQLPRSNVGKVLRRELVREHVDSATRRVLGKGAE